MQSSNGLCCIVDAAPCSLRLLTACGCGADIGGSKKTPECIKMEVEVVGSAGRLVVDNAGDGRDETGAWTGTYKASASLWREGSPDAGGGDNAGTGKAEVIMPSAEYIARITPPQGGDTAISVDANGAREISVVTGKNSDGAPMIGISAGALAAAHHRFATRFQSPCTI